MLMLGSAVSTADVGEFGVTIGLDVGIYDSDGLNHFGGSVGFSYESSWGRHYLMLGGGVVAQDGSEEPFFGFAGPSALTEDARVFSLGYRHGFVVSEKFEPFLELGVSRASWSLNTSDAFGNPAQFSIEEIYPYFSVGLNYQLYKDLYLTGSVSYLIPENSLFGEVTSDAFGNPVFLENDVSFVAKLGLTLRF